MKKQILFITAFFLLTAHAAFAQWNLALKPGSSEIFFDMDFFKSNTGIITGVNYDDDSPVLYRSTDKGQHWTKLTGQFAIRSVSCVNTTIAYGSNYDNLYKTIDKGTTWTTIAYTTDVDGGSGEQAELDNIRFTDENNGLAYTSNAGGALLFTSDMGHTWKSIYHVNNSSGLAFFSKDNKNISVVSGGFYLISNDSGATWDSTDIHSTLNGYYPANITFIDASKGFMALDGGHILKTNDAGENWTLQDVDTALHLNLKQVTFIDALNGFITGESYTIWRTSDGGNTWKDSYISNGDFFGYDLIRTYFFNVNDACSKAEGGIIDRIFYNGNLQAYKTALAEKTSKDLYTVYPNPTVSQLFIQSTHTGSKPMQVSVIDISGREVIKQDFTSQLNTSKLETGIYTLIIKHADNSTAVFKIVKL